MRIATERVEIDERSTVALGVGTDLETGRLVTFAIETRYSYYLAMAAADADATGDPLPIADIEPWQVVAEDPPPVDPDAVAEHRRESRARGRLTALLMARLFGYQPPAA